MALTRTSARAQVKYRLGERTDLANSRLDTWLDGAAVELAARLSIGNLEDIDTSKVFAVGVATLAFPTDFVAVTHIYNTTKAYGLRNTEWIRLRDLSIVSGEPRIWAARKNTLYFNKKADAADALDIAGQKRIAWAAGDSATPGLDVEYEYGIVLLAVLRGARDLGNTKVAMEIENPQIGSGEFQTWVSRNNFPLISQALQPPDDGVWVNLEGYQVVE